MHSFDEPTPPNIDQLINVPQKKIPPILEHFNLSSFVYVDMEKFTIFKKLFLVANILFEN